MYSYLAHELNISSSILLSTLVRTSEQNADACISYGSLSPPPPASQARVAGAHFCVAQEGIFLFWNDVGTILVRNGREIIVDPGPEMDERELVAAILGPAMAALLHQRGKLVLHASTVAFNDEAFTFIGEALQGKSTLALALYALGNGLVADDVSCIDVTSNPPHVAPAYPRLNALPGVLTALSYDPMPLEKVEAASEKRCFPAIERFPEDPLPLCGIYELVQGKTSTIERLAPDEALKALCYHSYCLKFCTRAEAAVHLSQCASLIKGTPVNRLMVSRSSTSITGLAELVQKHVRTQRTSRDHA